MPESQPAVTAEADVGGDFSFSRAGAGVAIFWRGRQVKTVAGAVGARLLRQLADADGDAQQELMARAAGKFARGTEHRR